MSFDLERPISDPPGDGAPALLGGRYLLAGVAGHGGMAVVYRAWDSTLRRTVAVKLLRAVVTDPTARMRFEREGETLARLSHPGLISVYDAGVHEDRPYLVMEFVDGDTLSVRRAPGPMAPAQAFALGASLAQVLVYVHEQGIAHRDVKPGNVLLGPDGRVRLADFGLARVAGSSHHTGPGITMGTAAYMAPEQVRGEDAGPPADIYALGLVLLELLSGQPAYVGTPESVALARLVSPPTVDPGWPPAVRDLLLAMVHGDPAARPSALRTQAALRRLAAGDGGAAPATGAGDGLAGVSAGRSGAEAVTDPVTAAGSVGTSPLRGAARGPGSPGPGSPRSGRSRRVLAGVAAAALVPAAVVVALLAGDPDGDRQADGGSPSQSSSPSATSSSGASSASGVGDSVAGLGQAPVGPGGQVAAGGAGGTDPRSGPLVRTGPTAGGPTIFGGPGVNAPAVPGPVTPSAGVSTGPVVPQVPTVTATPPTVETTDDNSGDDSGKGKGKDKGKGPKPTPAAG